MRYCGCGYCGGKNIPQVGELIIEFGSAQIYGRLEAKSRFWNEVERYHDYGGGKVSVEQRKKAERKKRRTALRA